MRAVVQRVSSASVRVDGEIVGSVGRGLLVYLGVGKGDGTADIEYLLRKIASLRIFEDENGKMNLSVSDAGGAVLLVSQFTLQGDVRKGNRPSFDDAEAPAQALLLYEQFAENLRKLGFPVATGKFQAHMEVSSVNDGPVTILLDSRKLF